MSVSWIWCLTFTRWVAHSHILTILRLSPQRQCVALSVSNYQLKYHLAIQVYHTPYHYQIGSLYTLNSYAYDYHIDSLFTFNFYFYSYQIGSLHTINYYVYNYQIASLYTLNSYIYNYQNGLLQINSYFMII